MTRKIGFVVFPQFQILDLTGPLAAFEMPGRSITPNPYDLQALSELGGPVKSSSGLVVSTKKIGPGGFDTLIAVRGLGAFRAASSPGLKPFVGRAAKSCRRLSSVYSGPCILPA